MKHLTPTLVLAAIACGASCAANAAPLWNETFDGDFSNSGLLTDAGGTRGGHQHRARHDRQRRRLRSRSRLFQLRRAGRHQLTSLIVRPETNVSGGVSFIGLQIGPQLTAAPNV